MSNKIINDHWEWMRLSEAAEYLGVHFTTLRRWSDSGEISYFKTPGGWRRFKKSDLDGFLHRSQKGEDAKLKLLGSETAKPEIIHEIKQLNMREEVWYGQISKENQRLMASHGRKLIGTLIQYASRNDEAKQYLKQGKKLAEGYGQLCQQSGLSITQTVQTFVMIRHSIVDSLCEAGIVVKDSGEDTWKLYQRVNHFMDVVLLTILEAFQTGTTAIFPLLGSAPKFDLMF